MCKIKVSAKTVFLITIVCLINFGTQNIFCETGIESSWVYPVPCYFNKDKSIKFTDLPKDAIIDIYTLNGEKVLTIYEGNNKKDFQSEWKFSEYLPSSDVYIYIIKKDNESKAGKVIVIK